MSFLKDAIKIELLFRLVHHFLGFLLIGKMGEGYHFFLVSFLVCSFSTCS